MIGDKRLNSQYEYEIRVWWLIAQTTRLSAKYEQEARALRALWRVNMAEVQPVKLRAWVYVQKKEVGQFQN